MLIQPTKMQQFRGEDPSCCADSDRPQSKRQSQARPHRLCWCSPEKTSSSINSHAPRKPVDLNCDKVRTKCVDLDAVGGSQSDLHNPLDVVGHAANTKTAIDVVFAPRVKL